MPITAAQSAAILEVINIILAATTTKGKRHLAGMFLELVDRTDWPQYYEIIPEPRCLNGIKSGVEKGRYKEATDVYTDLSLVFWNALFYNEPTSQIGSDAKTLKALLETEWKKKSILPFTRSSPPPSSAQKVHKVVEDEESSATTTSAAPTPAPAPTPVPVPAPAPAPPRLVTPAQNTSVSTATSTSQPTYAKPVPIRPKSRLSPDMDVDIMSEDGGHDVPAAVPRDQESEEIVKQLEKGLPPWPGFGKEGWSEEVNMEQLVEILQAVKSYKDVIGNRLATALETVPEEATIPHLSYNSPLSFKAIENRLRSQGYLTSQEFDQDMARLFEKARRWHKTSPEPYGRTLLLQRFYQALLAADPPSGPPYHTTTNFAACRAGPGNVKPVHGGDAPGVAGVTTHRVLSKDRTFMDEVHYKGWTLKLGDWVHLSNPDDPSRPIVAQVFRTWVSDEPAKKGQPGLTVSWYYRPEQTFHPSNRMFWEGEVFKTSHFADHPVEDIIEKIACQFTARHIRGRPRPPYWYLGWPLYVCDSRYNDRDRVFVKIKNWNSCVPEEVRKSTEFMPIYPFERLVSPSQFPSPFIGRGAKGPGGLVAAETVEPPTMENQTETLTNGRNLRTRKSITDDHAGGAKNYASGGSQSMVPSANITHLQPTQPSRPPGPDRSVLTAAGALAVGAHTEKLPAETAKHFDRDPVTNEVLWFPAPPVNIARPTKPKYSLTYLHFLATKRKRESTGSEDNDSNTKRGCFDVPATVTETLLSAWKDINAEE
ncbi:Chromatin structure-remodeling complex subunit rsc1 [Termitomyces sp. J132]|nr:hypothetical protein H2248_000196 [Termitomyces sp. 'cryptogamus']KNZ75729.1 Chromatin structure-remodeling complex subunit rsc1 [Termitomyces sp. J132]